ncbi:hypothetical protein HW561_02475 [Rhodobacteraceae bacterium B1Z28]|uniref:Uncharacterized protein n=1 Tax=Ruegeria haliotis TaxID=2747601 RepID=A0ABX2PKN8_9RHOB|nr:hypothetical protein [Ruegeria haliotis]NVO54654.1 hypothetical protein [Ruegeria haliotis]
MLTMLGELIALGALGALLAGAAAKALEAEKVRVRADAKKNKRGRR